MRLRITPASVIAAAATTLIAAGCGGSSKAPATTAQTGPLAYAHCMRAHGVPNFPDPASTNGGENKEVIVNALQHYPRSKVQAAQTACIRVNGGSPGSRQSQPHGPAQVAAMVAFARCMRGHGFPRFPDPTSSGDLTHQMVASAGINLNQPAVLQAGDACSSVTHGLITKVIVARFVSGQ